MRQCFLLIALFVNHSLFGFDAAIGFAWNSIDESFKSKLSTNENKSGKDRYETSVNRLAPVISVGHHFCFCNDWVARISAEWKYLNYRTPNLNSSRGQILPNATFSSINIFGPKVIRDFTSKTHLYNEVLLLGSVGREICNGFLYLGLGPVLFNASNSIFVSSVHTPNGVGDHLISSSVKDRKIIWGGAVQAGYQYFFNPNYFINIGYTYIQTGTYHFKNSVNASTLNGFNNPGPTTLSLKRAIKFTVQEFALSMNLMF